VLGFVPMPGSAQQFILHDQTRRIWNSRQPASIGRLEAILVRPAAVLYFSRLAGISTVIVPDEVPELHHLERGIRTRKDGIDTDIQNSDSGKVDPCVSAFHPLG
jgi:hypothetical protein